MEMELEVDAAQYTLQDLRATIRNLELMWGWLTGDGASPVLAPQRAQLEAVLSHFPDPLAIGSAGRDELEPAVAHAMLILHRAGRRLAAAGLAPDRATGEVTRLNLSDGGVPKLPVPRVEVTDRGVIGDRQASRQHHGRPWQALCLWSQEVIDQFQAEGHPIEAGSAGENITIGGIDWASIRGGVQLEIGSVVCEVTAPALPCKHNAQWFANRDFSRMHHERGPVSRAYACVIQPGIITAGDPVTLLP